MIYKIVKRFFDFILSLIALIVISPLFFIIIIILLLTGEHHVFYFQERIGKRGKPFYIWKFATMLKNSANIGSKTITVRNDPRILPFGRFLRKTKLNELPQLINILKGDMSIVGPRPLVKRGFDNYTPTVRNYIIRLKPGLSGIGSVIFRDEEHYISQVKETRLFYQTTLFPYKEKLEIWYYQHRSLYVDMMIIFLTIWVIIFPKSRLVYKIFPTLPQLDFNEAVKNFNSSTADEKS